MSLSTDTASTSRPSTTANVLGNKRFTMSPPRMSSSVLADRPPPPATSTKRTLNKKQLSLKVPTLHSILPSGSEIKSCPGTPAEAPPPFRSSTQAPLDDSTTAMSISSALRGRMEMRRRTSLPKLNMGLAAFTSLSMPTQPSPSTSTFAGTSSQHNNSNRLLGRGSESLNDAMRARGRSDSFPYEMGPVEILPGIYLGSEQVSLLYQVPLKLMPSCKERKRS
jgi:hypothetical protein